MLEYFVLGLGRQVQDGKLPFLGRCAVLGGRRNILCSRHLGLIGTGRERDHGRESKEFECSLPYVVLVKIGDGRYMLPP